MSEILGDSGSERDHFGSNFSLELPSHGPTARAVDRIKPDEKEAVFHFQIRVESREERRGEYPPISNAHSHPSYRKM